MFDTMPERPLDERELRIVRGMIDDHEMRRIRRGIFGEWWRDGRVLFALLGGILLVTLQVLQVVVLLGH
jgi:hypothetical protein